MMAVLVSSCLHEEDDFFDDSSANRADATIEANIDILTSASNGWHMEYFPAHLQEFGGYNLLLSFGENGKVTVAGDISEPDAVATSLYSVKQSAGILLSFDTKNEIFHYFADPDDPSGAGGNGYGMEGDYDFLILEASAEKVVLKGKKTGGIAVLTPMQGNWSEFITTIQSAEAAMADFIKYEIEVGGDVVVAYHSHRTLKFIYTEGAEEKTVIAPYVLTGTGYKFYEPVELKGTTLTAFIFDSTNQYFTEAKNPDIKLTPVTAFLNEQLVLRNWYIKFSSLGNFLYQLYYTLGKATLSKAGSTLNYAFIGSGLYGSFGFNFDCDGNLGMLGFDYTYIGEDKIKMGFNFSGKGSGVYYYNIGLYYMLAPFGLDAAKTFTLSTDNIDNPTYIILKESATSAITLYREPTTVW